MEKKIYIVEGRLNVWKQSSRITNYVGTNCSDSMIMINQFLAVTSIEVFQHNWISFGQRLLQIKSTGARIVQNDMFQIRNSFKMNISFKSTYEIVK